MILLLVLGWTASPAGAQTKLPAPVWRYLASGDSIWMEISLMKGDKLEWSLVLSELADNNGETNVVFVSDIEGELWRKEYGSQAGEVRDEIRIKKAAKYRLTVLGDATAGRALQMSAWPKIGSGFRDPFPRPSVQRLAVNFAEGDHFIVEYEFELSRKTSFSELMELELPHDLMRAWAITPQGDSLVAEPTVKRWLGEPGKISLRERGGSRGGRLTLRLEFEIPVAGETGVFLAPGSAPPEWLPDEARVMTTHLHAPWRAAVVPPPAELRRERMTAELPIMQSIYAAQSLRIRGLDSLIVRELTAIYVERDSLIAARRMRWSSVEGYDTEFLKLERAFLPPDLHVAVALPLSEQNNSYTVRKPISLQWFVAGATGGKPEGKLHVWKYKEGLAALPQAPDEIFWAPELLPLEPNLLTFGIVRAEYAETVRLDPPSQLRPARTTLNERPLLDYSRHVMGMYLENSSNDTLYLVYRQTTPFERSITTVISRWPKGARIAIIILFIVGLVGAYALYELRQREARRRKIAEEMAVDLDKARQVQEKLLPTGPMDVKGLEVFGLHQSMQSVGGDYYDFFPLTDGRVLICVADVAGHGLAAAMLMSNLQATLHAIAETPRPINELVAMLNQEITKRTSPERFVTLILAEISADRSQLTICSAGHNPGYLIRKSGKIEELDAGGIMLGVMEMFPYIQMDYALEPGDVIALYTDGIPEAEIGFEDMFGYDRLQYFLSEHRDQKLQDIAQKLFRKVTLDDSSKIDDDMAVVLVRMKLRK